MIASRVRRWAPLAALAEWVALAAGLALFGYVGWDAALWDARLQTVLHLMAVGAIAGLLAMAARREPLPRTAIDLPLIALLAAYAAATASATNAGISLRAMAAVVAFAAMLPVALVALRRRPEWVALAATLPVIMLSAIALLEVAARRVEWYLVGGPGLLPPVRLPGDGSPLGSVAVPPFAILAVLPLALLIADRRLRRGIQIALATVGIPLTVFSGSRSAWLAILVAAGLLVAPAALARRGSLRRPARWSPRAVLAASAIAAGALLAAAYVAPRLTAFTSLIYRGNLWRDTLAAWSVDPLLGIGPGLMPYARQAAAAPMGFPVRQPHSHNIALGVLGDAGLIGLAAAVVVLLAFAWRAGPWRAHGAAGRSAGAVLAGIGVAGLFEDLTFIPNISILIVTLAAVALSDSGAVAWGRRDLTRSGRALAALAPMALAAAALLTVMATGDAAAIAYRAGIGDAASLRWSSAADWLSRSMALDPWHPAAPRALAVAADAAGEPALARRAAEQALALNPGDGVSWTNLALLCLDDGDDACAASAAARALERATPFGLEPINAALVLERLGDHAAADDAYRLSLLVNPFTSLTTNWPRAVELGEATVPELDAQARELHLLLARHLSGERVDPQTLEDRAVRALGFAIENERAAAEGALANAEATQRDSVLTWDVAAVLRRHWGEPLDRTLAIGAVVRGSALPSPDLSPRVRGLTYDIGSFRAYPGDEMLVGAEHLVGDQPYPWLLERVLPDGQATSSGRRWINARLGRAAGAAAVAWIGTRSQASPADPWR